ncbi:hypothetical protein U1Q18_032751, partial [Sarracenia purpurea var. burkii]
MSQSKRIGTATDCGKLKHTGVDPEQMAISDEDSSISGEVEDDEMVGSPEVKKNAEGESDPKVAMFGIILGTHNVFDNMPHSDPK